MGSDLNKVILIGRTVRDFECRYTPSGTAVASTSLANGKSYKNNSGEKVDSVSYFDIIAWAKLAEIMTEYVKKGNRIAVEGRLVQRKWKDQEDKWHSKVEVVIETFQFLNDKKAVGPENENKDNETPGNEHPSWDDANPFSDSDVPF